MLEMVEPVRRLHQRRTLPHHRIGEASPVLRRRIADNLLRKAQPLSFLAGLRAFLELPAPRRWWLPIFALERAREGGLRVEADGIGDVRGVLLAVAKHVRRHAHSPSRAVPHRRLADQLGELLAEHRAGDACLAREPLDVEILGVVGVDDRKCLRDCGIGKPPKPARWRRAEVARHIRRTAWVRNSSASRATTSGDGCCSARKRIDVSSHSASPPTIFSVSKGGSVSRSGWSLVSAVSRKPHQTSAFSPSVPVVTR